MNTALHDRLPEAVRTGGVIRVATDASYAPASFFAPDGHEIIGFEPDLAAALSDLLGVRFEFTNEDFSTIIDRVERDQYDLAISAMTDNAERTFPQNSDALLQVRTGRAAAVLNDYPPATFLVNAERTKASYQLASNAQYEPGQYGIGVSKNATALRDVLLDGMNELIDSGRYAEVLAKWDVADGAIAHSTVNGAT